MKIIFLDIDGVLNWRHTEDRIGGYIGLCPERIARLNQITDAHPDAKIVISSTWRRTFVCGAYQDFKGLVELLHSRGIKAPIYDHTPIRFSYCARGEEIRSWIEEYQKCQRVGGNPEELDFVILDDDTDGMLGSTWLSWDLNDEDNRIRRSRLDLRPHHVVSYWEGKPSAYTEPGYEGGLLDEHVRQAIEILGGKLKTVTSVPETDDCWETVTKMKDD